ncbi:MAG: DUF2461 domain-containing protein, partial [Jatrophihabitans sp.]
FYEDLEADNSKSFWTAHKAVYDEQVRAPMVALMAALEPEFGAAKLFRPYRDVRFSKDKTAYKTHQGAVIQQPGRAGLYMHVDAAGLLVGGGRWRLESAEVARFRDLVLDDVDGAKLEKALVKIRKTGFDVSDPELQRLPSGVAKNHPRADLLRRKSLVASRSFGAPDWLATKRAATEVAKTWRALAPMLDWLDQVSR